jgi:hypothetical protein
MFTSSQRSPKTPDYARLIRTALAEAHGFPATFLMLVAFDGLTLSACYETMSLQIGLAGRDRFLIPFKANARHIGNVKQSVTNFIWLL